MSRPIGCSTALLLAAIIGTASAIEFADAQNSRSPRLSFSPAAPTTDQTITVTLFSPNGCSPEGTIRSVRTGNAVSVSHVFDKTPAAVDAPCEESAIIDALPAGQYEVEWLHDYRFRGQVTIVATAALTVVSKAQP